MATKPDFTFVDVTERPKQNSMAIKRQRLIEGLTKQSAEVVRFAAGRWSPRMWFWADDSGKFYLEVRYAKKLSIINVSVSEPHIYTSYWMQCRNCFSNCAAKPVPNATEYLGFSAMDTAIPRRLESTFDKSRSSAPPPVSVMPSK